jgi:hypothetical protein
VTRLRSFWRGEVALGRAFWLWGIVGGGLVNLYVTLLGLALLAAGVPAWLAVLMLVAPIPWNLVLLVGVWRSAGQPAVARDIALAARLTILVWIVGLCLL